MKTAFWIFLPFILPFTGCDQGPVYLGKPLQVWAEGFRAGEEATRQAAVDAMVSIGKPAVPYLVEYTASSDDADRVWATRSLIRLGEEGRQKVHEACEAGDVAARISYAEAMIREKFRLDLAVQLIGSSFGETEDWPFRLQGIKALGLLGHDAGAAAPGLAKMLTNPNDEARSQAAYALARIGPTAASATPALIVALHDKIARVREASAYALGEIGTSAAAAIPALQAALSDANAKVRHQATLALQRIAGETTAGDGSSRSPVAKSSGRSATAKTARRAPAQKPAALNKGPRQRESCRIEDSSTRTLTRQAPAG